MEISKLIDSSNLRKQSIREDVPILNLLLREMQNLYEKDGQRSTIFAACPNSLFVLKASLRAAKRAGAPIKFAATLNQVDIDSGYTGWTPDTFVRILKQESSSIGYTGPIIVAVDHGGPWLKDKQATERLSYNECMESVKKSFEAMISAGYDLLHIDPTLDIFNENIKIETVVNRTVELISHSEKFIKNNNLRPISYEVGTEEVKGGLADLSIFNEFLRLLKLELAQNNLSYIWPVFVVGKVGTDLHTTYFDPELAKKLVEILKRYGSYLKGHYTDYVSNPHEYPLNGVGGANIGPEFTSSEYDAFEELSAIEEYIYKNNFIALKSDFMKILENAVMKSGRWKKWLRGSEKDLESLSYERKKIIIQTSSRYVWAEPVVKCAQQHLFENLKSNGIDAENWVLMKIEKVMDKYFREFNLIDLIERIDSNK